MSFARSTALALVVAAVACDRTPPPPPPPLSPVESESAADAGHATSAPEASPIAYDQSTPVRLADVVVLRDGEGWRLERQDWKFEEIEGVAWRARFPLDASVELPARDDVVDFSTLLPADDGPWVAINGGFYEAADESFRPMGLVVSEGEERTALTKRGGSGVFFVDADGAPRVLHRDDFAGGERSAKVALQSIDRIVADGKSVVTRKEGATGAARSAVVVGGEYLWLVVAAARDDIIETTGGARLRKTGTGLPLWAFADYVIATTDARDGLNLDGGVSTQIAARDGDYSYVVSGVRGTVNAVVLRPASASERDQQ